jgi:flagellar biosynthesis/type III secretory pathway chaperone
LVEAVAHSELTETLAALEALHEAECIVLTKLDRAALDGITEQKLALCERLQALAAERPPAIEHKGSLDRIRRLAIKNRLLALHARDAVRTILSEAGFTPPQQFGSHRPSAIQDGVRVNWKG